MQEFNITKLREINDVLFCFCSVRRNTYRKPCETSSPRGKCSFSFFFFFHILRPTLPISTSVATRVRSTAIACSTHAPTIDARILESEIFVDAFRDRIDILSRAIRRNFLARDASVEFPMSVIIALPAMVTRATVPTTAKNRGEIVPLGIVPNTIRENRSSIRSRDTIDYTRLETRVLAVSSAPPLSGGCVCVLYHSREFATRLAEILHGPRNLAQLFIFHDGV